MYEHAWMKAPGVEGVGIGKDIYGDETIIIYTSDITSTSRYITLSIQGYIIRIEQSGEFNAYT